MIILLVEFIMIVAYMYKSTVVGLIAWLIICLIQYKGKVNSIDFWIKLLICSLPISYLEITGEIGSHIFRWYNLSILGLAVTIVIMLIKNNIYISKNLFIAVYVFLAAQLIRNLFLKDTRWVFRELLQEYVTIITIMLFWFYVSSINLKITKAYDSSETLSCICDRWTDLYLNVTCASAVAVILQQLLYVYANITIGNISFFLNRVSYDMTFTGYSVLSSFLGGGIIIAIKSILDGKKITKYIWQIAVILFAIVVNSSRSGMVSAFGIILAMVFFAIKKKSTFKRTIIFVVPITLAFIYATFALLKNRNMIELFDPTGRDNLINYAINIMFNDVGTFLFGMGINSSEITSMAQHNMFLEFWVLNGTILTIPFFITVFSILWLTKKKKNKFILWQLLLAHQFFSSFFATTFLPVVVILTIASGDDD